MASEGDLVAGKYRLERFLGSGGFASVWAARNEVIDRPLALKILSDTYARKTDIVQRFQREAKIACRPIHPAVLRVEDVGQTAGGTPFLVMELLEGRPLSLELKRHKALPLPVVVAILRNVLEGLAAAHDKGIIHRDIKPSNIFVMSPGSHPPPVRILDLGVAKDLGEEDQLTTTGQLIGTPSYLAPEILVGGEGATWTEAVDVFACGMVLFVALTARLPFDEDAKSPSHIRVAERVLYYRSAKVMPRASTFAKELPPAIDDLIARAMCIKASDRFANAGQMLSALEEASVGIAAADPSAFGESPATPYIDEAGTNILSRQDEAPTTVTPPSLEMHQTVEPVPVVMIDPTPAGVMLPRGPESSPSDSAPPPSPPPSEPPPPSPSTPPEEASGPEPPGPPSVASPPPAAAGEEPSTPLGWPTESSEVSELAFRPKRGALVGVVVALAAFFGVGVALALFWPAGEDDDGAGPPVAGGVAASTPPSPPALPSKVLDGAAAPVAVGSDAAPESVDEPVMARVRIVGVPRSARVTFDGEAVGTEGVEGPVGHTGELVVVASGFDRHEQELTLSEDMEVDLAGALRPSKRQSRPGGGRAKRPSGKQGPRHIDGRRPGSKIKVISRPAP